jgi:hypothetical protein
VVCRAGSREHIARLLDEPEGGGGVGEGVAAAGRDEALERKHRDLAGAREFDPPHDAGDRREREVERRPAVP